MIQTAKTKLFFLTTKLYYGFKKGKTKACKRFSVIFFYMYQYLNYDEFHKKDIKYSKQTNATLHFEVTQLLFIVKTTAPNAMS